MRIETGKNGMGCRWARSGEWRVVAYAEGGYCPQRRVEGIGWCLLAVDGEMPPDVEAALVDALGLDEVPFDGEGTVPVVRNVRPIKRK